MPLPDWDRQLSGEDCAFCRPMPDIDEYGVKVADLSVTRLRLSRDQTYRGCCALIFTARHATGIEHLTEAEYAAMTSDLRRVGQAITAALQPDLMNYASLGNSISHLHWHVIPRYKNDPRWRTNPFWWGPTVEETQTRLGSEEEYQELATAIQRQL